MVGAVPVGNSKLLELGAVSFPDHTHNTDLTIELKAALEQRPTPLPVRGVQADILDDSDMPLFDRSGSRRP